MNDSVNDTGAAAPNSRPPGSPSEIVKLLDAAGVLSGPKGPEQLFILFVLACQRKTPADTLVGMQLADIKRAVGEYLAGKDTLKINVFEGGVSFQVGEREDVKEDVAQDVVRGGLVVADTDGLVKAAAANDDPTAVPGTHWDEEGKPKEGNPILDTMADLEVTRESVSGQLQNYEDAASTGNDRVVGISSAPGYPPVTRTVENDPNPGGD